VRPLLRTHCFPAAAQFVDDRVARVEQLSDAELLRIAKSGYAETVTPVSRLLTAPR
jgi:hypothetical protein